MEKTYIVSFECHTINKFEVQAKNKKEAEELGEIAARGMCSGDGIELYEIEEL